MQLATNATGGTIGFNFFQFTDLLAGFKIAYTRKNYTILTVCINSVEMERNCANVFLY